LHQRAPEYYARVPRTISNPRNKGELREPGDAIAIPPGKKHKLWNTGTETLRLLCCCAPAYEHEDTVITET
jgi:mannose-6-phosphate isomerase-like protein (cupin superfamily)